MSLSFPIDQMKSQEPTPHLSKQKQPVKKQEKDSVQHQNGDEPVLVQTTNDLVMLISMSKKTVNQRYHFLLVTPR